MKKRLLIVSLLITVLGHISYGQFILRPPTQRFSRPSQRGNIVYVANSIINSSTPPTPIAARFMEAPPGAAGTGSNNNGYTTNYIDIDGDATTYSSSSADLNLASCTEVLFAGLYWGAGRGGVGGGAPANSTNDTAWIAAAANPANQVRFRLPGGAYTTVTASVFDRFNQVRVRVGVPAANVSHSGYMCFADVTTMVRGLANPNGTYFLANMVGPVAAGKAAGYGGWTMVIVYADPLLQVRNLTVFDGCVVVSPSAGNVDVNVAGFITPPAGPVSCQLGAVVIDGDRNDGNDAYQFSQNGGAGPFLDLTPTTIAPGNATSRTFDTWNSTISYNGAIVTSRNPAYTNTHGYDADIFELPNAGNVNLDNDRTSATVRFNTSVETYHLQVITTSISNFNPSYSFAKTSTDLSGGSLTPGDSLRYQMNYGNFGNDTSTNSRIFDNIPTGTSYKPGSIRINGVLQTDAIDADQANYDFANNRIIFNLGTGATGLAGGEIPPFPGAGSSGNVTFEVYMPSSCAVISCSGTMRNRARMMYNGKKSLSALEDSSGVLVAGCLNPDDRIDIVTGSCSAMLDTILTNRCPSTSVMLPVRRYSGYTFYSAIPFIPANRYNPATPVTSTRVMYAFYDAPGACIDDTARISIFILGCPDIDDDNDGIPDYLESTDPVAIADQDGDGRPNWADNSPGAPILWVDNTGDGINDWYDPGADVDNDGIPNFYDTDYFSFIDTNGDGVNDRLDKDLDGIPNFLDLDSDNDGIPDTAESFGVDANGDGRIDNYADVDVDGLSDNVDAVTSGGNFLSHSGLGLGALDTDADGVPNYLDLDSDNDGIPDITEAFGTDAANSARVSVFADMDGDGYSDALDADVGNDLVDENSAASLLRTSTDGNGDGRTDSWPNKNMDADSKPNPYDLDSDGDGITDVIEAQFTDANMDARVDGAINLNGRNTALAALGTITLPNTDGVGRSNPYDIDSDDDGIPDNVEGQSTLGYLLPSGSDSDADGIDNSYDSFSGFGGNGVTPCGITPWNEDGDGVPTPDYIDSDTDNDGLADRFEGNDFNFNNILDDLVTLTGLDTDGDGLDNRFDANNSSSEGTSARMGNGGTTSGDASPGSTTVVQRTAMQWGCSFERDWRCLPFIVSCDLLNAKVNLHANISKIDWEVLCKQEVEAFYVERGVNRESFFEIQKVDPKPELNEVAYYTANDNISQLNVDFVYYRIKTVSKSGKISYSPILTVRKSNSDVKLLQVAPNPVTDFIQLVVSSKVNTSATMVIVDANGKVVYNKNQQLQVGSNTIVNRFATSLAIGTYYIKIYNEEINLVSKFHVVR